MSNIAIKGAATGSGTFTLEAPATSTNRTLVLPDEAGTMALQGGAGVGKVLQVVQTLMGQVIVTTTSSSFVSMGHSVSITPSSAESKILLYVLGGGHYLPLGNTMAAVTIFRGATNIGNSSFGLATLYTVGTTGFTFSHHSMMVLDSPATTAAITYTTYAKTDAGTYQYQYNDRGSISFVAMEIAA